MTGRKRKKAFSTREGEGRPDADAAQTHSVTAEPRRALLARALSVLQNLMPNNSVA